MLRPVAGPSADQGGGCAPSAAIVAAVDEEALQELLSLPVSVERFWLQRLEQTVGEGMRRLTTLFFLEGLGAVGVGEDVTYEPRDHELLAKAPPQLPVGRFRLGELCDRLAAVSLHPAPPTHPSSYRYRLWAAQSAALDLALLQAGKPLHALLGLTPQPVRFVHSLRLPEPPSAEPVLARLNRFPTARFKLDPTARWDLPLIEALAATGAVDVLDLKAHYKGTPVDQRPTPTLLEALLRAFPGAIIEDPLYDEATKPLLAGELARISYDAPIEEPADLDGLGHPVRIVNVKPSRLGGVRNLFALLQRLGREGVAAYGGGQFELGPGRAQIQYLASLFYARGPNDVAPTGFNLPQPPAGLPESPLQLKPPQAGITPAWSA